jgi:hypothetical protein
MPGTPYPKQQMHRIAYTKLTPAQIAAKLAPAAAAGPTSSASPLSDVYAGKALKIVTDKTIRGDGPTLEYKFKDARRLTVSENGGKAVDAGYGAQTMGKITVFTHLIPGTQRGYAVVVDRDTGLATVAELWFSGYQDNREVQRELWYGYVDQPGKAAPAARHVLSNRIEGHGYHWKQDNGIETLEFYPSAAYSHFVELTRLGGELGFCGPSDYVKVDDDYFIYDRTECEFSGTFTLYAIDLNRIEQVGARLGFNADDALEYYTFKGKGEWIGAIAQFEKFGDVAGNPFPPPAAGTPDEAAYKLKGYRRVYRPLLTMAKMDRAGVDAACKTVNAFPPRSQMAGNSLPISSYMVGKTFTLRYDNGPAMEYRVSSPDELEWRKPGGNWTKTRYQGFEVAPGVVSFGHLLDGEPDHDGHMVAADFDNGLVTCFNGHLNTPYFANEAGCRVHFGVIEQEGKNPPRYRRHQFTDELLGRVLSWNYQPGLTSMHLYSTPHSMSWIIFTNSGGGGTEWSGPAGYVKLRDELYYLYWLEEACNGTLGTIVVNMRTMHDAGIDYNCGTRGLNIGPVGAHARHAGRFDISRFYQIKS